MYSKDTFFSRENSTVFLRKVVTEMRVSVTPYLVTVTPYLVSVTPYLLSVYGN